MRSLALLVPLTLLAFAAPAQASTPSEFLSEIITPAGWELHSSFDRCSWNDLSVSDELVIPADWGPTRTGDEPSWGGCVCSDLVVPVEWRRAMAH